jgi:hypothetical protein
VKNEFPDRDLIIGDIITFLIALALDLLSRWL